jgi:hypothetical protein
MTRAMVGGLSLGRRVKIRVVGAALVEVLGGSYGLDTIYVVAVAVVFVAVAVDVGSQWHASPAHATFPFAFPCTPASVQSMWRLALCPQPTARSLTRSLLDPATSALLPSFMRLAQFRSCPWYGGHKRMKDCASPLGSSYASPRRHVSIFDSLLAAFLSNSNANRY